jgi:hypothetical protein
LLLLPLLGPFGLAVALGAPQDWRPVDRAAAGAAAGDCHFRRAVALALVNWMTGL